MKTPADRHYSLTWTCVFPAVLLLCSLPAPSVAQSDWPQALDSALSAAGLTQQTARFDLDAVAQWGGDRYSLARFRRPHANPWILPQVIRNESSAITTSGESLFELLILASRRTAEGVRRGLIEHPADRYPVRVDSLAEPFVVAMHALYAELDTRFLPSQENSLRKEAEKLSAETRSLLAAFSFATADWLAWRKLALRRITQQNRDVKEIFRTQTEYSSIDDLDDKQFAQFNDFLELIDLSYLYTGALDLAAICDFLADSVSRLPEVTRGDFVWDTPLGRIAVSGDGDHVYTKQKKYLLILDVGGDDTYHTGGATVNASYHTGVIVDLKGHDTYTLDSSLQVGFGAGLLGVGLVYDLAGHDRYDGGSRSLGTGIFGVGGLSDRAGNDSYRGVFNSQGVGLFGIGVLSDLEGDDTYYGVQQVQGFGYVRGCGILYDRLGNDLYEADDVTIDYPSSQTPEHNNSLAQGVGFGYRADFSHGHSLAGGIGYLVDGAGDDRYKAGLFAQGCAYWYALGMLADLDGNDRYSGIWYVQGSGAHFAVGTLYDQRGADVYEAEMNMAQGAGHDFTVGFLWDAAGDDTYRAPNLSLGGGNANGIGIFRDDAGDDTYEVDAQTTLGCANSHRPGSLRFDLLSLGLFLDLGGTDTYPAAKDFAGNGRLWMQPPPQDTASTNTLGVGLDTEPAP